MFSPTPTLIFATHIFAIFRLYKTGTLTIAPGFFNFCVQTYVCVCESSPPRLLITSGVVWHEIKPIRLVKQVLQVLYGCHSWYY